MFNGIIYNQGTVKKIKLISKKVNQSLYISKIKLTKKKILEYLLLVMVYV